MAGGFWPSGVWADGADGGAAGADCSLAEASVGTLADALADALAPACCDPDVVQAASGDIPNANVNAIAPATAFDGPLFESLLVWFFIVLQR